MILMYHGVVADSAPPERSCNGQAVAESGLRSQLEWLKAHRRVVPLEEYLRESRRGGLAARRAIALTFDDGMGETFRRLHPLLREMDLPAALFVSTAHLNGGSLLWFSYLNALCFETQSAELAIGGRAFSLRTLEDRRATRRDLEGLAAVGGDPVAFARELEASYPVAAGWARDYGGMTHAEVALAARDPLLEVGAHTESHPWLSRQPRAQQAREIEGGRDALARLTARPVRYFAYPGGDYDRATLEIVRGAGFDAALATIPKRLGTEPFHELGRIGIYSESLPKLRLKAAGIATVARAFGIEVG